MQKREKVCSLATSFSLSREIKSNDLKLMTVSSTYLRTLNINSTYTITYVAASLI